MLRECVRLIIEAESGNGFYGCTNFAFSTRAPGAAACSAQFSPSTGKGSRDALGRTIAPGSVRSHETPCPVCTSGRLIWVPRREGARPPKPVKLPVADRIIAHLRDNPRSSIDDLRRETGIAMDALEKAAKQLVKTNVLAFERATDADGDKVVLLSLKAAA